MPAIHRKIKRYGYIPSLRDKRNICFKVIRRSNAPLPDKVDLATNFPFVPFDQGELGSCTANATVAAITFDQQKQGETPMMMSRLFLYYYSRQLENTTDVDSGAMLSDVFKAFNNNGIIPEVNWPYTISQFASPPPLDPITCNLAAQCKPVRYMQVGQTQQEICEALLAGYPIVNGWTVYESFEDDEVARTGNLDLPMPDENVVGGHATVIVGYDLTTSPPRVKVRNSWGTGWAQGGYFTMPMEYVIDPDLTSDLWVLEQIS